MAFSFSLQTFILITFKTIMLINYIYFLYINQKKQRISTKLLQKPFINLNNLVMYQLVYETNENKARTVMSRAGKLPFEIYKNRIIY